MVLTTSDGVEIALRSWPASGEPRATVVRSAWSCEAAATYVLPAVEAQYSASPPAASDAAGK